MRKEVTHIDALELFESKSDWDSHLPLLHLALRAAAEVGGSVSEVGLGFGSTVQIATFCVENNISHIGYENNLDWHEKIAEYVGAWAEATVLVFGGYKLDFGSWLVFVDCAPAELRKEIIERCANTAKVIVVHDSEIGAEYVYGMADVLSKFKYRLDYKPEGKPHTTAVSNFIDVTKWV